MKLTSLLISCVILINSYSQNVGIGTTTPQSQLSVGPNSEFRVDAGGNIIRINNVPFSFPATQGASGKTLVNDGNGNLSWKEAQEPLGSMVFAFAADTASFITKGYSVYGIGEFYYRYRIATTGTWSPFANAITLTGSPYLQDDPSVWNGTEMMVYYNNFVYRWNPSTTAWTQSSPNSVAGFLPVTGASGAWNGTEMIIYGGIYSGSTYSNKGVKYNPSSNTWTAIANGPYKKAHHSAVWTGTEMIVWGGDTASTITGDTQSGYKYNSGTNTWSAAISTAGAPFQRRLHGSVWTGSKMIIFAGTNSSTTYLSDSYSYDPAGNTWAANANTIYPMTEAKCVWTGNEMLAYGSYYDATLNRDYTLTKVYTPATNTWTDFSNEGVFGNSDSRSDVVWTGTQMIVMRGFYAQLFSYSGQGYSVSTPSLNSYYIMRKYQNN